MRFVIFGGGLMLWISASQSALAQATANATKTADDAFGYTVGDDTVGIYDQSSVRGFDLESAGNYRINGHYFVKSSGVSSFFLESTTVRIGYNTISLNLPGPSGVVDYRLRDPARDEPHLLTVGLDENVQPYLDLHLKHRATDDRFSVSAGLGLVFRRRDAQGGVGNSWLVAGTARASLGDAGKVQIFLGEYDYVRQGRFRVIPSGNLLPARLKRGRYLGQDWASEKGQRRIAGFIASIDAGSQVALAANAVFSQEDPTRAFSQFIQTIEGTDWAHSILVASPQQRSTAWSGEVSASWLLRSGDASHNITLLGRARFSRSRFGGDRVLDLGTATLGQRAVQIPAPDLTGDSANLRNNVNQRGVGLAYQFGLRDRIRLNAGLLKTVYRKAFRAADGEKTKGNTSPFLYNVGALVRLTPRAEIYSSHSRGLEEAGTAPASAVNRNAVLDAIVATQTELGFRYTFAPGVTAILAGFDTHKPYAGINTTNNRFELVGTVRHRGIEASLSGPVAPGLSIVAGGVFLRPRLSGLNITSGLIGVRPVGVPSLRMIGNVSYEIPSLTGFSIDAGGQYIGAQARGSKPLPIGGKQLRVPSKIVFDVGARYRVAIAKHPVTIRLQMLNVTDEYSWNVGSAETLDYSPPRRFRLLVTEAF